jgi:hypothetical protein
MNTKPPDEEGLDHLADTILRELKSALARETTLETGAYLAAAAMHIAIVEALCNRYQVSVAEANQKIGEHFSQIVARSKAMTSS